MTVINKSYSTTIEVHYVAQSSNIPHLILPLSNIFRKVLVLVNYV